MASRPFHARAQGGEELVQLLERLAHSRRAPGGDGGVERFPEGTVWSRLHDARKRLQLELG
jgi:hypothetical protein